MSRIRLRQIFDRVDGLFVSEGVQVFRRRLLDGEWEEVRERDWYYPPNGLLQLHVQHRDAGDARW